MTTPSTPQAITRSEARKLSAMAGQRQEPYRGYGHALPDGRFVFCEPQSGTFFVRPAPITLPTRCAHYPLCSLEAGHTGEHRKVSRAGLEGK